MESNRHLNRLLQLPSPNNWEANQSKEKINEHFRTLDKNIYGIDLAIGAEAVILAFASERFIPSELEQAYEAAYPTLANSIGLEEKYEQLLATGNEHQVEGLISGLKGKVAEMRLEEQLENQFPGYDFELAADPTQGIWDLHGIPDGAGEEIFVQVKMNVASNAGEIIERMENAPDVLFAVNTELYGKIIEQAPELAPQLINTQIENFAFTTEVKEAMGTVAEAVDIDVPDAVTEIIPYVAEIILAIRLIKDLLNTEKDLGSIPVGDKRRIQAVRALVFLARFGVTSVMTTLGSTGGGAIGGPIGAVVGALGGMGGGISINKELQPRLLEIGMKCAGIDEDDLFYYQNKKSIDRITYNFSMTSVRLSNL